MNQFILSDQYCPIESARMNCDIHTRSQSKEGCQILSNCFTLERMAQPDCPRTQKGTARKHSYPHHPCCKWVKESTANMDWVIQHTQELFNEYTRRHGKHHFTESFLNWVIDNVDDAIVPEGDLTPFPVAINQDAKCRAVAGFDTKPVFEQYRLFYKYDKPFAKWEKGQAQPNWFKA